MASSMSQKQKQQKLTENLVKRCRFSKSEIECLLKEYQRITGEAGRFDRNKFRDMLHDEFDFTDDMIMDSIFRTFDKDNDNIISMEEWVKGLSVFLRGDLDERAKFCFSVYDLNADGVINRDEIYHLLKLSLIKPLSDEDPEEGVKELVEMELKKMDKDNDHRISFEDFIKSVKTDELLLESMGQCLPVPQKIVKFQKSLFQEITVEQNKSDIGKN